MHAACLWCNTTFEIPIVYSAEYEGGIASAHARRSRSERRRPNMPVPCSSKIASACTICFRARARADTDEGHGFLRSLGVTIIRAPREDQWAPAYYSLLFEDPEE